MIYSFKKSSTHMCTSQTAIQTPIYKMDTVVFAQAVDTRIRELSWRNSSASFFLHRCLLFVTDTVAICVRIDLGS